MSCARNAILATLIVVAQAQDAVAAPCIAPERPFLPQSREDMRLYADLLRADFETISPRSRPISAALTRNAQGRLLKHERLLNSTGSSSAPRNSVRNPHVSGAGIAWAKPIRSAISSIPRLLAVKEHGRELPVVNQLGSLRRRWRVVLAKAETRSATTPRTRIAKGSRNGFGSGVAR